MKRGAFASLLGLLFFGLLLFTVGCNGPQASSASAAAPAATPAPPPKPPVPDYYETSGPLVVENQVDVLASREGEVARILVDTGTPVQKGSLLAELDNRQLQAQRDAADARVKSIEADTKNWDAQSKVLESDLSRDEEMWKAELITEKAVEHSRYRLIQSRFELERERHNLKNAQSTLRSLELELEKTRIVAPFAGVVARRYVRAGQRVAVNDRLFWVTATAPLKVQFTLPEMYMGRIHRGDEISVQSAAAPGVAHAARITVVSPVVDPSSSAVEVQAQLEGEPGDLHPGMTATIRVKKAQ